MIKNQRMINPTSSSEILKNIRTIRDFINNPRKQYTIMRNRDAWYQLCSSLDVVRDTELALLSYNNIKNPEDLGARLIIVFGILQIMFVQQDAVKHLAESLNLSFEPDPLLKKIREARNSSIGHPTKLRRRQETAFNFIVQHTVSKHSFKLMTMFAQNHSSMLTCIKIPELIQAQRKTVNNLLDKVIVKLKEEEMEHREKFKHDNLVSLFPQSLLYHYEKINEEISNESTIGFGAVAVDALVDFLDNLRVEANEREPLEANEFLQHKLEQLTYAIEQLKKYFEDRQNAKLNDKDACIFLDFIRKNIDELYDIAEEIDNKYESELLTMSMTTTD